MAPGPLLRLGRRGAGGGSGGGWFFGGGYLAVQCSGRLFWHPSVVRVPDEKPASRLLRGLSVELEADALGSIDVPCNPVHRRPRLLQGGATGAEHALHFVQA